MVKRTTYNRNPFRYGVVVEDNAFCNRKQEIKYLKDQIANGYSTWLFSPRRFGKTSLVEKVFRETRGTECIFFDLYNIKSLDDFSRKYSNILAKNLFNWKDDIKTLTKKLSEGFSNLSPGVSFDEYGNPSFSLNVHKIEKQVEIDTILALPEKIAKQQKKRLCIAFDEFQEINRIDSFLINWMRSSFQRQQHVSYIFLGSKQSLMEDIFTSNYSPFYEFAAKMDLKPISSKDLSLFIEQNFRKHKLPVSEETILEILDVSECQPHFTQYFASLVFDLTEKGYMQDDPGFHEIWKDRIINSQTDIFQNIYDQLTNSQRLVLFSLARLEDEGIYSDSARKRFDLPVSSSINEIIKALQKRGLIYKTGDSYKITNPIMKLWLLRLD